MNNKTMIVFAVFMLLAGCADMKYPDWEQVNIVQTVFKKPCQFKKDEMCTERSLCDVWYKKRATLYKANTVVITNNAVVSKYSDHSVGDYFYCAPGNALFIAKPNSIWLIRNKFNPSATQLDLDKTMAKCKYETSKAALNINTDTPAKAVMYGSSDNALFSLTNTLNQIDANQKNERNAKYRAIKSQADVMAIYSQCLEVDGFISTKSADEEDLATLNNRCPGIDNDVTPCFVPGDIQK